MPIRNHVWHLGNRDDNVELMLWQALIGRVCWIVWLQQYMNGDIHRYFSTINNPTPYLPATKCRLWLLCSKIDEALTSILLTRQTVMLRTRKQNCQLYAAWFIRVVAAYLPIHRRNDPKSTFSSRRFKALRLSSWSDLCLCRRRQKKTAVAINIQVVTDVFHTRFQVGRLVQWS